MQYTTILLSALAATGVLAAPTRRQTSDNDIRVVLSSSTTGSQTTFDEGVRQTKRPVGSTGPFSTVELRLGDGVQQQNLRCQALDNMGNPLVVLRGANRDITFADGDKGEWTFEAGEVEVSQLTCDPAFKQGIPQDTPDNNEDTSIRVQLSDGNLATQTPFFEAGLVQEVQEPVGSSGPFNTVTLMLGADVKNQALRCKLIDLQGMPITLKRGQNIDTTFADGDGGAWTFLDPKESEVREIICDPTFVKASA